MTVNLREVARDLRKSMTDAERVLWLRLKARQIAGLKFRRQEQIGRFIVDFVCFEAGVIVEADGSQHGVEQEKDQERTLWLNSQGYTVLRFWNHDILNSADEVVEAIRLACKAPLSPPLSHRGERE